MKKTSLLATCSVILFCSAVTSASDQVDNSEKHNQWLKDTFSEQHQALIPKVAVADMFYGCNLERKVVPVSYQLADLITSTDRGVLAEQLANCLGEDSVKSDVALNFGLKGCFTDHFSEYPKEQRERDFAMVERAITSLTREERQKSFTKCVTEQAIKYLN